MKTDTITAGQLKQRTRDALDRAQAGESMTITRHGRPVARLVPYTSEDASGRPEEASGVSEVDGAAEGGQGPVWVKNPTTADGWLAYLSPDGWGSYREALDATVCDWRLYVSPESHELVDHGNAGSLAANIRAATAAWNKRHPDRLAVVPERFRDDNDKARKGGESEG